MKENIFPSINPVIINKIQTAENILIIAHKNPDGDALSSTLALSLMMEKLGKNAYAINEGPFLRAELSDLADKVSQDIPEELIEKNPLVIVADCSTPDRPGIVFEKIKHLDRIVIDHHSSGDEFAESNSSYIVPYSPSTTLLVDVLRESLGLELDKQLAEYFYTGLATDTGFFHFISNRIGAEVFKRAASYTEAGVDPYTMYDKLTDGKDIDEIFNSAEILKKTKQYFDGHLLIAIQPKEMEMSRLSDDIYSQLLKVKGVKAVVFLKEKSDRTEIGFRAKNGSDLDVGELAHSLGGGGHSLAAGASLNCTSKEAERKIVNLFTDII